MDPLWNPPAYLVTVPHVVPPQPSDDSSDGEEDDKTFTDQQFKCPPFAIDWQTRGQIAKQDELKSHRQIPYESPFIKKVGKEAFGKDTAQVKKRVAVVIGNNRMRSLSNAANRALVEQSARYASNPILNREIHFFWRPQWKDTTTGKKVGWERVHQFYRQLKKRDRQEARLFRQEREGISPATEKALNKFLEARKKTDIVAADFFKMYKLSHYTQGHILAFEEKLKKKAVQNVQDYLELFKMSRIVPYREIREQMIKHPKTAECAKELQKGTTRPLYVAVQDDDAVSMQGVFSKYDQALQGHLKRHKMLPEVASGGYNVKTPLNPILEIGVLIDLWVRHFTAQFFPTGVYYPEPNTLVRIKEGEFALEASFTDRANYASSQEMPTLIADLIKKRKISNLSGAFLFDASAALTTAVPVRMQKQFQAFYTSQHKVVRWSVTDLKKYKGIAQTHYSNRSWATNICEAVGVPERVQWNGTILSKKDLRELVISMIARVFSSYDPFESARTKGEGFQKAMINLLNHYQPEKLPLAPKETRRKNGKLEPVWTQIDAIKSMEQLLKTLDLFMEKPGIGRKIQLAAQQAMQAAVRIFKENLSLNFTELSIAAMMSLDKPLNVLDEVRRSVKPRPVPTLDKIGSPLHQHVITTMVELDWTGKPEFKKMVKELPQDQRQGYLGTYPMHWAAITGNVEAVRFLKSCKGWVGAIDQPGQMELLPLHCALRYCADNGEDLDLIRELATKDLVCEAKARDVEFPDDLDSWTPYDVIRESPLLQALEELYYYPRTLRLLFQIAEVEYSVQEELLALAKEMEEDAGEDIEPKTILSVALKVNCSPETIEFLLRLGAEFKTCQSDLDRCSPFAVAIDDDYGDEEDRLALIEILVKARYDLQLTDCEELTPLAYAIEKENLPVIEKLLELGAEPTESERDQIEEMQREGSKRIRREEPLDEEAVEQLDVVISGIRKATNLTVAQKQSTIKRFENLKERQYYYEDNCFGNQLRLARKRPHP